MLSFFLFFFFSSTGGLQRLIREFRIFSRPSGIHLNGPWSPGICLWGTRPTEPAVLHSTLCGSHSFPTGCYFSDSDIPRHLPYLWSLMSCCNPKPQSATLSRSRHVRLSNLRKLAAGRACGPLGQCPGGKIKGTQVGTNESLKQKLLACARPDGCFTSVRRCWAPQAVGFRGKTILSGALSLGFLLEYTKTRGFPGGSVGQDSACNAGDEGDRG